MEQVKKAKKVRKVRKVKKKKIANLATQGSHERVDEDGTEYANMWWHITAEKGGVARVYQG